MVRIINRNNMNIAEILKNAPKGTKLYSPVCGEAIFCKMSDNDTYPIVVNDKNGEIAIFTADGRYNADYLNGKCLLFPSKDNRDWSTFKVEPQFPTDICNCGAILDTPSLMDEYQYKKNELNALRELLICRDAWWKVDNDWRPDWENDMSKYSISPYYNEVTKGEVANYNRILVFRTEEIRDKFFETFRDLIEKCKELI